MNIKQTVTIVALSAIVLAPTVAFAQPFTYTSTSSGTIPDNNAAGISSTISVTDNFVISDFSSITITGFSHTWLGDVIVTLSHGGNTVDILDRIQGNNDNFEGDSSNLGGDYTFVPRGGADFNAAAAALSDTGVVSLGVAYNTVPVGKTTPPGGVLSANGFLLNFARINVNGAWTLNISDRASGATGSFTGWRFTVISSNINTNTTISDATYSSTTTVRVGNTAQNTDVTLAAGGVVQNVTAFNNSRFVVSGGAATSLRSEDTSKLYVNYGTVSGAITATESSTAYINGGTVGSVVTTDNANAYVLAGTFGGASASGSSHIFVYGGGVGGGAVFAAAGGASISLFGDNLAMRADTKTSGRFGGTSGFFYDLSGTLTDGTSLVGSRFFDADGGKSVVGENSGALFLNGVAVVPETGTLGLLAVGMAAFGLGVVRRKRQRISRMRTNNS